MNYKILFVFALFIIFSGRLSAQLAILQGVVVSSEGQLIHGVEVAADDGKVIRYTGTMGDFNFEVPCPDSCKVKFSYLGYETKEIYISPHRFATVVLNEANMQTGPHFIGEPVKQDKHDRRLGFHMIFGADIYDLDFNEFEADLGQTNVDYLNRASGMIIFKLGFDIRRIYFSFDYGFGSSAQRDDEDTDSIFYEVKRSQYGIHLGYQLINSRRFMLTPDVGLKWYRSRLINSPGEYEIELDDYFHQRSLDLRFVQLTWFAGINFHYRMGLVDEFGESTWTIGAYVGYLGKVNAQPWTRSVSNKLMTDNKVGVGTLNWGITAGFYIK